MRVVRGLFLLSFAACSLTTSFDGLTGGDTDASPEDGGADVGAESGAGIDAGADAGADAGTDGGAEGGTDAGKDASADVVADTRPPDAGPDAACAKTLCGAQCVDLTSNSANCGKCGHGCLGAACVGGVCQEIAVSTGEPYPSNIAVNATTIYWTTEDGGDVRMCPIGGGARSIVASGGVYAHGITLDASRVYWTDVSGGTVQSCPLAGCGGASPTVIASGQSNPYQIATDGTSLFWTNQGAGTIMKCPVAGCGGTTTPFATGQLTPAFITVYGGKVYWAAGDAAAGAIRSCPTSGCGAGPTDVATSLTSPWGIGASASGVFWCDRTAAGKTHSCALGGCATPAIVGPLPGYALILDGANLFVSNDATSILTCPVTGCATATTVSSSNVYVHGLAVDANAVYWIDRGVKGASNGVVRKVAKP